MASKDCSKRRAHFGFRSVSLPLLGSINLGSNTAISITSANLSVWIMCRIVGILVSVSLRPLFVTAGIEAWMTPRPFIFSCLALMVALLCWLIVRT
jgi:hypothetical protein